MEIIDVKGLRVYFRRGKDYLNVVSGVDIKIREDEIVGIAGESGSGKTVSMLSLTRILPPPHCKVEYEGYRINRVEIKPEQLPYFRGKLISYIFQDPISSLDPMFTIGTQLKEVLLSSGKGSIKEEDMIQILQRVGLKEPKRILNSYPHQLSGGMAQRVAIGLALASNSKILVADEPTTALDANLKKAILELLRDLKGRNGMSIFFISHDLNQIFYIADRIYIFYAGRIVEEAPKDELKRHPLHPYTVSLFKCIPKPDLTQLHQIRGGPPDFKNLPSGCKFHPRCELGDEECIDKEPELVEVRKGHYLRCFKVKP